MVNIFGRDQFVDHGKIPIVPDFFEYAARQCFHDCCPPYSALELPV